MPDFFLDEFLDSEEMSKGSKSSSAKKEDASAPSKGQVEQLFKTIMAVANEDIVKKTNAVFAFEVKGAEEGRWYLDLKNGSGSAGKGESPSPADATLIMDSNDFVKMFQGGIFHPRRILYDISFCSITYSCLITQANWKQRMHSWPASWRLGEIWARPWNWKSWWVPCSPNCKRPFFFWWCVWDEEMHNRWKILINAISESLKWRHFFVRWWYWERIYTLFWECTILIVIEHSRKNRERKRSLVTA